MSGPTEAQTDSRHSRYVSNCGNMSSHLNHTMIQNNRPGYGWGITVKLHIQIELLAVKPLIAGSASFLAEYLLMNRLSSGGIRQGGPAIRGPAPTSTRKIAD